MRPFLAIGVLCKRAVRDGSELRLDGLCAIVKVFVRGEGAMKVTAPVDLRLFLLIQADPGVHTLAWALFDPDGRQIGDSTSLERDAGTDGVIERAEPFRLTFESDLVGQYEVRISLDGLVIGAVPLLIRAQRVPPGLEF